MDNELKAITADGREVVLQEDGGWSYRENPEESDKHSFRRSTWGDSPDQVQESEEAELVKASEEGLVYKSKIARFPCLVAYIFAQGRLVRAKYTLLAEHALSIDYLNDFDYMKNLLMKKYGDPSDSQQHWVDSRYKDDEESWGRALALGHLVCYEAWSTEATDVSLMVRGEGERILLEIEYSSKLLENLEEDEVEEEAVDLEFL